MADGMALALQSGGPLLMSELATGRGGIAALLGQRYLASGQTAEDDGVPLLLTSAKKSRELDG